jgi:hypothetical protein
VAIPQPPAQQQAAVRGPEDDREEDESKYRAAEPEEQGDLQWTSVF